MTDELMEKAFRVGKIAAIIILAIALAMIVSMVWRIANLPEHREDIVPEYQKVKIEKYMVKHRIRPSVIEIESSGKMTYILDGKRCEIK